MRTHNTANESSPQIALQTTLCIVLKILDEVNKSMKTFS